MSLPDCYETSIISSKNIEIENHPILIITLYEYSLIIEVEGNGSSVHNN